MGMQAICPNCQHTQASDNQRGAKLGGCPQCGTQMRAWTAGRAKGRYLCPWRLTVVTLEVSGIELDAPYTVEFRPGYERFGHDRAWRSEPGEFDAPERTAAIAGVVLGPGCVVSASLDPAVDTDTTLARVVLKPAPDADPSSYFVNEKLKYRQCAACNRKVPVIDGMTVKTKEWTARPRTYRKGRGRYAPRVANSPGPHPAGTVACAACDPQKCRSPEQ